ncbi:MAG TPA: FecR domain-containing protein [Algoriphagus sp.]|nr:FecR domain-containing protein [Algoriphagus sp.]
MCKADYSVEDFVLDPEFKKWVLNPDAETKIYWEEYLKKNPSKNQDIVAARKLLLNISRYEGQVSEGRIADTWSNIEKSINEIHPEEIEGKIIPLNAHVSLKKYSIEPIPYSKYGQVLRVAAILVIAFFLAFTANFLNRYQGELLSEAPVEIEEHVVPAGVKSHLTLWDGSKVVLNSGSSIRYIKNFEPDQRVVELTGEAFFEVTKDPSRPFIVKTNHLSTRVLGTSFNIKAIENETVEVALFTGRVEVSVSSEQSKSINLTPGEALSFNPDSQQVRKGNFNQENVIAWTQKTIVFEQTHMNEIKRVLENWYGVEIQFLNRPDKDLEINAKFKDQSLEDVLEGLSYSARFDFEINSEKAVIKFK